MILCEKNAAWAGTEQTLDLVAKIEEGIAARISTGNVPDDDDGGAPRLLSVDDAGLATISIKGPLVNSDSMWNEIFGVTGYPEIREAVMAAVDDPNVKHILLDIDSGGGAVSGVDDTAKLIRMVNNNVKPVTTFSDGTMASAAIWLGASAGKVYAGKTAMVGSIGVIARHADQTEALKKEGVTVTTIRAGKEKALANPYEKLSEKGRQQIQQMVDATYGVFVDHIATVRGKTDAYVREHMADGKEFIGATAADVGLIDKVTTYDEVVSSIHRQLIDHKGSSVDTRGKFAAQAGVQITGEAGMKRALTEQDVAAIAAGAAVGESVSVEAAAEQVVTEQVATEQAAATQEPEGAAEAQAAAGNVDNVAELKATVALLNSQLVSANDSLLAAKLEVAKRDDKVAALEAVVDPMKTIVASAINNMSVALGGSPVDMAALSVNEVVARHQATAEQFKSKFKVGGVAAVTGEPAQPKQPQVDPRHLARVNAVRFNK